MRERTLPGERRGSSDALCRRCAAGVTLIETLIVIAIIATLATIAVPSLHRVVTTSRNQAASEEMRQVQNEIMNYQARHGELPDSLDDLGKGPILDPWGRPYQYLKIANNTKGKGKLRKDRFLVPLNSDYDLYSMGEDGQSRPALTAKASRDDIVRANDGGFFGLASEY